MASRLYSGQNGTYKLHGAVVDKEVLDLHAPVWSEFEASVAFWRHTDVAAPGVDVFEFVEGSRCHQDFYAVFTETPGEENQSVEESVKGMTDKTTTTTGRCSNNVLTCSSWRCHTEWPLTRHSTRCNTTGSHRRHSETAFPWSCPTTTAVFGMLMVQMEVRTSTNWTEMKFVMSTWQRYYGMG